MTALITGSTILLLLVCQVHTARGVGNAEINTRSDFLKRLKDISGKMFRNPGNVDKWPKTFQRGIPKRRNRLIGDGTPSTSINEEKPSHVKRDERKRTVSQAERISYQCPTGLWCAKKRSYRLTAVSNPTESRAKISMRSPINDHIQGPKNKDTTENFKIMPQTSRRCTSELGCSERNGEKEKDESSNKLLQRHILDQSKKQCPVGLWCSSKREAGFENSENLKNCPPGLWCKRNEIQSGESFISKRAFMKDGYQCPTGLWCSSKREKGYANSETLSGCPPGLWCKRDNIMPVEIDIVKKGLEYPENSETLKTCPPGLWCKKNTIDDIKKARNVRESCPTGSQRSFKRHIGFESSETLQNCPPGLWCRRSEQRDSDGSTERNCPPGLWCKRNGGKIREAVDQTVDDCAYVSWCLLKRKLSIVNRDVPVKSK
ncbi:hypothetical protein AWC38_SpisGene649 [Stylophora pistillata]|uniref:Uncharacterized protein n=1 Tax=Stylophora pistillata TaxID=50429 RepID=A0A2B4T1B5_STYPI|nr:hypothetical protein AWC38_SpisGene649 [Stylophora pistillata]